MSPVRHPCFHSLVASLLLAAGTLWGADHAAATAKEVRALLAGVIDTQAATLAVQDLTKTYGARYPKGADYEKRLTELAKAVDQAKTAGASDEQLAKLAGEVKAWLKLREEALLANPLIDFDQLLFVRRATKSKHSGLPQNWQGNSSIPKNGYDNEIASLSPVRSEGKVTTVFKPAKDEFVGDLNLHFDADRLMFSMPTPGGKAWNLWEVNPRQAGEPRQISKMLDPDVDCYDGCYLPDGHIVYMSSATYQGVPCVGGSDSVANLYRMDADGANVRRLCMDQEMNWSPMVMNDGRVLYTRWEYTDTAHYFTRLLFSMNPDGTGQMSVYKSNSYWPNSMFYTRQVPGAPSKLVTVISGHHGVARQGELILLDLAKGRVEAEGVVQRIPGRGKKVEPVITDQLVNNSWPKFLHPQPLSDKYFLVSCKLDAKSTWGIYLVDVFDNLVPLLQQSDQNYLEPLPFRKTTKPPVIPDRIKPGATEATVFLTDVYSGPGLSGIPRGTVKKLRLLSYHFAYRRTGGHTNVGIDGPWDVHRILGTVPVLEDGSASFVIPSNTPVAVQPLDEKGRALAVMRSWFTAMPGEVVSCVGCHDQQNATVPGRGVLAYKSKPAAITPWYGPPRNFAFRNEVQPVLDRLCVGCHDGTKSKLNLVDDGTKGITKPYRALHPYTRRPGVENDYHLQKPYEFHVSTSELVQLLSKGHHGVKLDDEAWDRITTWIDLNVPALGTWAEAGRVDATLSMNRAKAMEEYAYRKDNLEDVGVSYKPGSVKFVEPAKPAAPPAAAAVKGWPFAAEEAKKRQQVGGGLLDRIELEVAPGAKMELSLIPAGEFAMGDVKGEADEWPVAAVKIAKPFYMSRLEVTNALYRQFDAKNDCRFFHNYGKDQSSPGEPLNRPEQPVVRVSWHEALAFCDWLSKKSGRKFTLPTEAQWEWACRAGTDTPMNYGAIDADFSKLANFADKSMKFNTNGDWLLRVREVNDGSKVSCPPGKYAANAWGLYDMHGNVAEWTLSTYRPYPYNGADGRDAGKADGPKTVRGGSYYDRPLRGTSSFRLAYQPEQKPFNVGFRVICDAETRTAAR